MRSDAARLARTPDSGAPPNNTEVLELPRQSEEDALACKTERTWLTYNHMVVCREEAEESLNQLFRALADGTRRDILARSLTQTPSVSDLAARYEMSFAAVQKHVAVLERAGLIQKRPNGREQLISTNGARLRRAGELLDHFESIWRQRMAQLDEVLLPKGK
ncbi:MAG: ArsR/SmtB family transcription factor [Jatrophihabitans sp.]